MSSVGSSTGLWQRLVRMCLDFQHKGLDKVSAGD